MNKTLGFNLKNADELGFYSDKYEELFEEKPPCLQFFVFGKKAKYLLTPENEIQLRECGATLYIHCSFQVTMTRYFPTVMLVNQHVKIAEKLGAKGIIIHLPTEDSGEIYKIAKAINKEIGKRDVILYFEHTVSKHFMEFSKMQEMYYKMKKIFKTPIGICFDTCHIYASGGKLASGSDVSKYIKGKLNMPVLIHLNDSMGEIGSMVDRHATIGSKIWKDENSGLKKILSMGYDCIIELTDPVPSLEYIRLLDA